MQKDGFFTVRENEKLTNDVFKMILSGDTSAVTAPGQFINIKIDGLYLRRPISVCDRDEESITIIYKTVGKGTKEMSRMKKDEKLLALTGLGNGYSVRDDIKRPLLLGGGVGVPPLYALCKALIKKGVHPKVILGFNTKDEVFYEEEFKNLGAEVCITTADGSYGVRGFVTDALPGSGDYDYYYACGPEPMLKAVYDKCKSDGELSFEKRMGCGFGACMGCSCETKYGSKRICKDGPVLKKEEIIW